MESNGTLQGRKSFPFKTCKSFNDSFAASSDFLIRLDKKRMTARVR